MKKMVSLGVVVGMVSMFQACTVFVGGPGHGSDWGWHHGGWHHGEGSHEHHHIAVENSVQEMARDFGIRPESARALLKATHNELDDQQENALGLDSSDLMALAQLQMPSKSSIEKVAQVLNENPEKIERIADSFVTDVKAQVGDETSEYWQDCIHSGHWKTPENTNCSNTAWNGCAPSSGATACEIAE